MRLAELQSAFQAHVLQGDRLIEVFVPGTERFDTTTRLGIYDNAYFSRLNEAWVLDVVARGETFASVCEGLVEFHSVTAAPTQAAKLLRSWLQGGLIAGVELPAHEQ